MVMDRRSKHNCFDRATDQELGSNARLSNERPVTRARSAWKEQRWHTWTITITLYKFYSGKETHFFCSEEGVFLSRFVATRKPESKEGMRMKYCNLKKFIRKKGQKIGEGKMKDSTLKKSVDGKRKEGIAGRNKRSIYHHHHHLYCLHLIVFISIKNYTWHHCIWFCLWNMKVIQSFWMAILCIEYDKWRGCYSII